VCVCVCVCLCRASAHSYYMYVFVLASLVMDILLSFCEHHSMRVHSHLYLFCICKQQHLGKEILKYAEFTQRVSVMLWTRVHDNCNGIMFYVIHASRVDCRPTAPRLEANVAECKRSSRWRKRSEPSSMSMQNMNV